MKLPCRSNVIGSLISDCSRQMVLDILGWRLGSQEGGYVCFTNVHAAVTGRQDARFREVTNGSMLSLADGKPVYWAGRMRGARYLEHMPGPDFMLEILRRFPRAGHFFYGSSAPVLARLQERLHAMIPGLRVCGALSPPFRPLTDADIRAHYAAVKASGAQFVWVGLGAPKQEQWMAQAWRELRPAILLGVGAAFDFHAGTVRRAPAAMRALGLEWFYRLLQEPRRLWKRYLITNSLFIRYTLSDVIKGYPD